MNSPIYKTAFGGRHIDLSKIVSIGEATTGYDSGDWVMSVEIDFQLMDRPVILSRKISTYTNEDLNKLRDDAQKDVDIIVQAWKDYKGI